MNSFSTIYQQRKEQFEQFLKKNVLTEIEVSFHERLYSASQYTLQAAGKRIRPILCISSFLSSQNTENISSDCFYLATALECIHTYSLIHDDLPAMDNDDYRRGKPSCHKQYTEAVAILTGDALNSFGFYLVSKIDANGDAYLHRDILMLLHEGAGATGMVSGQMEDIEMENHQENFSSQTLESIHSKKTAALITSALLMGNRLTTHWIAREKLFRQYGQKLGLLFQLTDDLLDQDGTLQAIGKTPGKDQAKGKLTYPALYGLARTIAMKDDLTKELLGLGQKLDSENAGNFFSTLPEFIANRSS